MESVLVVCLSGVMYAGTLLEKFISDMKWIGIKPSSSSGILMYFSMDRIKKIYFQNGESKTIWESDLTIKQESNLTIPNDNIIMLRVNGGVTFRGERIDSVPDMSLQKDGIWITPSLEREAIIYIPDYEVEKVYEG